MQTSGGIGLLLINIGVVLLHAVISLISILILMFSLLPIVFLIPVYVAFGACVIRCKSKYWYLSTVLLAVLLYLGKIVFADIYFWLNPIFAWFGDSTWSVFVPSVLVLFGIAINRVWRYSIREDPSDS